MKQLETLSSLEGRLLLAEIYQELRFEKLLSSVSTLLLCWRICSREKEIFRYVKQEITVIHPLGIFAGSALWMEEIVNRYYFSTINSFVYFGAAILLILIGIRRFTENFNDAIVIGGVIFEATMLIFMFLVMLFSPPEQGTKASSAETDEENSVTDLIIEVGEIATDFAAVVVNLEQLGDTMKNLVDTQRELIESVNQIATATSMAVSPNPELLDSMRATNTSLENFRETINNLNISAESLKREQIEIAVRKEVERILVDRVYMKS